jgi:hypothetical protein
MHYLDGQRTLCKWLCMNKWWGRWLMTPHSAPEPRRCSGFECETPEWPRFVGNFRISKPANFLVSWFLHAQARDVSPGSWNLYKIADGGGRASICVIDHGSTVGAQDRALLLHHGHLLSSRLCVWAHLMGCMGSGACGLFSVQGAMAR